MTHSAQHDTFSIERRLACTPAQVYAAFATEAGKARWFSGPNSEWKIAAREFDFRIGGRERLKGIWNSGMVTEFNALYLDVVPDTRIVYSYDMQLNDRRISISLATIEFRATAGGTLLVITEQGVFLDGYEDKGSREHGTNALVDRMIASLAQ